MNLHMMFFGIGTFLFICSIVMLMLEVIFKESFRIYIWILGVIGFGCVFSVIFIAPYFINPIKTEFIPNILL